MSGSMDLRVVVPLTPSQVSGEGAATGVIEDPARQRPVHELDLGEWETVADDDAAAG